MRKAVCFLIAAVLFFMVLSSCSKNTPPTTPAATNTPAVTATETATNTPNATQTAAAVIATQTAVAAVIATQTAVAGISYLSLVSVPGGTFTQTDETGTNSFSHTISAFKMGKYQVTYELWYTVYQWAIANGYTFANAGTEGAAGIAGAAPTAAKYQPVTTINWRDAVVWCNAYSQMTGLNPVYCSDAGFTTAIKDSTNGAYGSSINTTAGSYDNPYVNWAANGFRLPTEGEYAGKLYRRVKLDTV